MREWPLQTLGDYFDVKHGFAFKGEHFADVGKYIVVTPGSFHEEGGYKHRSPEKYYTVDPPVDFILKAGDLVVAMTEQSPGLLGSSAWIPADDQYLHNQRIGLFVDVNKQHLDIGFLYYLMNSRIVRQQIQATSTGTKVKHTAPKRIKAVKVHLPPLVTQRRIADILSAYDDLIENNNRRMALLEESIHLLYREWFVYLRFPGHERTKIVDGVPEGWEKVPFSSVAEFRNGFAFKPTHLGDEGFPIVKIPELRVGVTESTPRNKGDIVPEKHQFSDGALLFSWSGSFVVRVWNDGPALLNQHLFQVLPYGQCSVAFLEIVLRESIDSFLTQSVGTTMKHIRRSALDDVHLLLPNAMLLEAFENQAEDALRQRSLLELQNTKLREARDTLLPRLMDGRLVV